MHGPEMMVCTANAHQTLVISLGRRRRLPHALAEIESIRRSEPAECRHTAEGPTLCRRPLDGLSRGGTGRAVGAERGAGVSVKVQQWPKDYDDGHAALLSDQSPPWQRLQSPAASVQPLPPLFINYCKRLSRRSAVWVAPGSPSGLAAAVPSQRRIRKCLPDRVVSPGLLRPNASNHAHVLFVDMPRQCYAYPLSLAHNGCRCAAKLQARLLLSGQVRTGRQMRPWNAGHAATPAALLACLLRAGMRTAEPAVTLSMNVCCVPLPCSEKREGSEKAGCAVGMSEDQHVAICRHLAVGCDICFLLSAAPEHYSPGGGRD